MRMVEQDVVTSALGDFGLWQARGILLLALVKIPAAWHMLSIVFTAPPPEMVNGVFWCARPNSDWNISQWIKISHPKQLTYDRQESYDACRIYDVPYPMLPLSENSSVWTQLMIEPRTFRVCTHFEFYQPHPTIVTKWELVCGREILPSVAQFFYLFGIMSGGPVTFLLSKKFSPRTVLLGASMVQILVGTGAAFSPWFELHCALKMLSALSLCCMFTTGFQICFDICGGWKRTLLCVNYEHFWSIGVVSLGWISDVCGSWVNLQISMSLPTLILFFLAEWIPDSPRWLISAGRFEDARNLLYAAALVNKRKLDPDFQVHPVSINETPVAKVSVSVAKDKVAALCVLWIIAVVTYYGGLLNMRNVGGPRLPARTSLAALAEIIGTCVGGLLLLRCTILQRFAILAILLSIGGTTCLASWALDLNRFGHRGGWPLLGIALADRVSIATALSLLSCGCSAELIPPPRRPLVILALVTTARLCLLSAPFINTTVKFGDNVPLSVYGILSLMGAAAALYLTYVLMPCCKDKSGEKTTTLSILSKLNYYNNKQPQISSSEEKEVRGIHFNPAFIPDSEL